MRNLIDRETTEAAGTHGYKYVQPDYQLWGNFVGVYNFTDGKWIGLDSGVDPVPAFYPGETVDGLPFRAWCKVRILEVRSTPDGCLGYVAGVGGHIILFVSMDDAKRQYDTGIYPAPFKTRDEENRLSAMGRDYRARERQ